MGLLRGKFLLYGDSITQYSYDPQLSFSLGAALTNAYSRRLDVVNRGFAGYNTSWSIEHLPRILEEEKDVKISTVFFGTNDAVLGGLQHVDLEIYKTNIKKMIELLKEKDIKVVIITPGFHDPVQWEKKQQGLVPFPRTTENNKVYAEALKHIAKEANVALVDNIELFAKYDKEHNGSALDDLLVDGVHYTGKAYKLLYDELNAQITKWYPELLPESLPFDVPDWKSFSPVEIQEF
jgi:lysophospholipase L1-like esterase